MVKNLANMFKKYWWLPAIAAGILVLFLIPAQEGLPTSEYRGCEIEGSTCLRSTIKSISKESDGSSFLTVPVEVSESKTQDVPFHLKKYRDGWQVGNDVFMNITPSKDKMYIFVGYKSNLFAKSVNSLFGVFYGSTAIIDMKTGEEIEKDS